MHNNQMMIYRKTKLCCISPLLSCCWRGQLDTNSSPKNNFAPLCSDNSPLPLLQHQRLLRRSSWQWHSQAQAITAQTQLGKSLALGPTRDLSFLLITITHERCMSDSGRKVNKIDRKNFIGPGFCVGICCHARCIYGHFLHENDTKKDVICTVKYIVSSKCYFLCQMFLLCP